MAARSMCGRTLLDVVVCKSAAILQLLASKDQALLVRWDTCTLALKVGSMLKFVLVVHTTCLNVQLLAL